MNSFPIVSTHPFPHSVLMIAWNNIITDWVHCPTDLLCSDNEILCSLNVNISTGLDAISAPILKQCTASIFCPLNATYDNLSICSGQIPAAWKLSNATPISKSTGSGTPSGYRPISLLSIRTIVSKELERHTSQHTSYYTETSCFP